MRSHFEHGMRSLHLVGPVSEAWIEKAGVMDAELAHRRIERNHFSGVMWRNSHALLGSQNVELLWVEYDGAGRRPWNRIPIIRRLVKIDPAEIDRARILLSAVTDDL